MMPKTLRRSAALAGAVLSLSLSACAVVTVAGAVAGAAISVTGAVVSTGVELTGKAIGAGIDAVSPDKKADTSGIAIKYTEAPASTPKGAQASAAPLNAPTPATSASASAVAPNGDLSPRPLPPAASAAG